MLYSQFKLDLGRTDCFETLGELIEAIYLAIYYYNTKRIHTALKMPPLTYKKQCENNIKTMCLKNGYLTGILLATLSIFSMQQILLKKETKKK